MFSKARIRLTAWYAGVLAAFLVVLGTAVYLVERHQLLSNVSHGLHVRPVGRPACSARNLQRMIAAVSVPSLSGGVEKRGRSAAIENHEGRFDGA